MKASSGISYQINKYMEGVPTNRIFFVFCFIGNEMLLRLPVWRNYYGIEANKIKVEVLAFGITVKQFARRLSIHYSFYFLLIQILGCGRNLNFYLFRCRQHLMRIDRVSQAILGAVIVRNVCWHGIEECVSGRRMNDRI